MRVNCWGSHIGLLYYSLLATEGTVVELGLGLTSTNFLHSMCCSQCVNRKLVSFECLGTWFQHFLHLVRPNHEFFHDIHDKGIKKYELYPWKENEIGVVLIDSGAVDTNIYLTEGYTNRIKAVKFFKSKAKIVLVHDTECPRIYCLPEWPELVASFKYCATDKSVDNGWITALSDFVDVENDLMPKLTLRKSQEVLV